MDSDKLVVKIDLSYLFLILFIFLESTLTAMAEKPCDLSKLLVSLFEKNVLIEKIPAKPKFQFQYDIVKKERAAFNANGIPFSGDLILPDPTTPLGRYANALEKKGHIVLVADEGMSVSAFQCPLISVDVGNKSMIHVPGVVFRKDIMTRRILAHEGYHAASHFNILKNGPMSHFNGKIFGRLRLNVAPDKKIIRESGEVLTGERYKARFEAAYDSLHQEEVHTFVKDFVNRIFINHSRVTVNAIQSQVKIGRNLDQIQLKVSEVILNPAELDAELIVTDAIVKGNANGLKVLHSDYETLKRTLPNSEREKFIYVNEDLVTKRNKVGFAGNQSEGIVLENVSPKLFSELKRLIIERNKNIPSPIEDSNLLIKADQLFDQVLSDRRLSSEKFVTELDGISESLIRLQTQEYISAKEYLDFKNRVSRLGNLASKVKH